MAVLTHDFSDGINTMNVVLKSGGNRAQALRWLLVDALAPAAGSRSTFFVTLPDRFLGTVLAVFFGFFSLYRRQRLHSRKPSCASEVSYHRHDSPWHRRDLSRRDAPPAADKRGNVPAGGVLGCALVTRKIDSPRVRTGR